MATGAPNIVDLVRRMNAKRVDHEEIKQFITDNPECINDAGEEGDTILHLAVKSKNQELINYCLKHKADISAKNVDGDTIYHLAVKSKNQELINYCLKHEADISAKNVDAEDCSMFQEPNQLTSQEQKGAIPQTVVYNINPKVEHNTYNIKEAKYDNKFNAGSSAQIGDNNQSLCANPTYIGGVDSPALQSTNINKFPALESGLPELNISQIPALEGDTDKNDEKGPALEGATDRDDGKGPLHEGDKDEECDNDQ